MKNKGGALNKNEIKSIKFEEFIWGIKVKTKIRMFDL